MKTNTTNTQILLPVFAALLTIASASPARAEDPLLARGDFNHDGLDDVAAVTSPTTVTIGLGNPDGSYTVSAILLGPRNQQITYVSIYDRDGDGDLDVIASSPASASSGYIHTWLGYGDGTFGSRTTERWSWPKGRRGFF